MSRPSRRKYGWGIMRRRITRSPLFPGPAPSPPLPVTRIVEPSCAPAGILTLIRSPSSVMPAPPHCGHPRRPDRPDPRHAGHALGRRYSRSRTEPFAMSRKSTGSSMARSVPRPAVCEKPPPRSRSPNMSPRSNGSPRPNAPGSKSEPPGHRYGPPPPNPPVKTPFRIASYSPRFFSSPNTSCASLISLNRPSAALSPGFTSGWHFFASRRNAFRISSKVAFSDTPNSSEYFFLGSIPSTAAFPGKASRGSASLPGSRKPRLFYIHLDLLRPGLLLLGKDHLEDAVLEPGGHLVLFDGNRQREGTLEVPVRPLDPVVALLLDLLLELALPAQREDPVLDLHGDLVPFHARKLRLDHDGI